MSVEQERTVANMIECRGVCKSFETPEGEHQVIKDLNMAAKENEFLVLFGPGQCGKTTIMNLIAGFEPASEGSMTFLGKEISKPGPERGVVFQSTALFPWMTTMGNVEYGLKIAGVKKEERRRRAQKYIDLVGLQGFENSFPVQLSGGMRQRVGIARAYCNEPKVMLMDEPFGALDAQTRYLMQEELQRIWDAEKRTVIFVTNNIEEAIYLADRILVLTNCPATVKREYKIELPRPRDLVSPEFLALRKEITGILDSTSDGRQQ
nr:ABC transporter ATP-binding protein [uncultured Marvinbryantia sp.]